MRQTTNLLSSCPITCQHHIHRHDDDEDEVDDEDDEDDDDEDGRVTTTLTTRCPLGHHLAHSTVCRPPTQTLYLTASPQHSTVHMQVQVG